LRSIVNTLKNTYPKKLTEISVSIPHVKFSNQEIEEEVNQLYRELMTNLAHPQLTTLTIDDETIQRRPLNADVLNSFFEKSCNLRNIHIKLKNKFEELTIPFHHCANLEQVTLVGCRGISADTFGSLRECKKLHTIIINGNWQKKKLMTFLMEQHNLDLKVLNLGGGVHHYPPTMSCLQ